MNARNAVITYEEPSIECRMVGQDRLAKRLGLRGQRHFDGPDLAARKCLAAGYAQYLP